MLLVDQGEPRFGAGYWMVAVRPTPESTALVHALAERELARGRSHVVVAVGDTDQSVLDIRFIQGRLLPIGTFDTRSEVAKLTGRNPTGSVSLDGRQDDQAADLIRRDRGLEAQYRRNLEHEKGLRARILEESRARDEGTRLP